jgi:hypothetical protein
MRAVALKGRDNMQTIEQAAIEKVAKAICKSSTCEGINCCQWPCNGGRWHDMNRQPGKCRVEEGRYDDAAQSALEVLRELID